MTRTNELQRIITADHIAWERARAEKPYRVTLTFELDNPDVNMCEGQRSKRPGARYSNTWDYASSKAAMNEVAEAARGYYDTLSEFVVGIEIIRWGKRRGGTGWQTVRKDVRDRKRAEPVNPQELMRARVGLMIAAEYDRGEQTCANGAVYAVAQ